MLPCILYERSSHPPSGIRHRSCGRSRQPLLPLPASVSSYYLLGLPLSFSSNSSNLSRKSSFGLLLPTGSDPDGCLEIIPPSEGSGARNDTRNARGRKTHRPPVAVTSLEVERSSPGRFLLAGDSSGVVSMYDLSFTGSKLWNATSGKKHRNKKRRRRTRDCGDEYEDDRLTSAERSALRSARSRVHAPLRVARLPSPTSCVVSTMWYPPDPGLFLVAPSVGDVVLYDASRFEAVHSIVVPSSSGRGGTCRSASISPSGGLVAVSGDYADGSVRLSEITNGVATHSLRGGHSVDGPVGCTCWIDERTLATGGPDGAICLWDVRRAHGVLRRWEAHGGAGGGSVHGLASDRTGRVLASASVDDGRVKVWHGCGRGGGAAPSSYEADPTFLLRPENKSAAMASSSGTSSVGAISGPILPSSSFCDRDSNCAAAPWKVPLIVDIPSHYYGSCHHSGGRTTAAVWTGSGSNFLGYALRGIGGGRCAANLQGHLGKVNAAVVREGHRARIITGSEDGTILCWGVG